MKEKEYEALAFLNGIRKDGKIESFAKKVSEGGFLRTAMISHLKSLYHFTNSEAEKILNVWLWKNSR